MPTPNKMTEPSSRSWYAINALGDSVEVRIYDEIGAYGITAEAFVSDLATIKAKTINLRINTPGGEVFDATAIYNAIRAHPANVVVSIDGVAASAGSFIAMAGNEVRMADNSYMMIHNARGGVMGEADDMRTYAGMLEKINGNIADIYARKSGQPAEYWQGLMDAETWFTAEEAKAENLIDSIFTADKPAKQTANASFDFTVYNRIPDPVREMWGLTQPAASAEPLPITKAPEVSTTLVESSPAINKEVSAMPESATQQATPAQIPAAANTGIPQGDTAAVNPSDAHRVEMARIKDMTAEATYEAGHSAGLSEGLAEGERRTIARFKETMDACPGDHAMAIGAFLDKQTPSAVGLAFKSANAVRAEAEQREREQALKIARLEQLAAVGGHPGVALAFSTQADAEGGPMDSAHAIAQAEREWDTQPAVRRTAKTRDIYVHARTAELDGTHRSFTR